MGMRLPSRFARGLILAAIAQAVAPVAAWAKVTVVKRTTTTTRRTVEVRRQALHAPAPAPSELATEASADEILEDPDSFEAQPVRASRSDIEWLGRPGLIDFGDDDAS